ncbi:hydroxymethylglutaryl-CoA lyase [Neptuniibacter sp. CAU 1671]|uniref:hydroxymethylglutaryl-CoA lyase n=1 Tax=Neptuniibacter sp. CAU 1671 TaxID=3032593 RepID=UPI0023D9A598|nr:hydroxymethylglutaryl-CoA lyase [Neptuniibacter sp. CAU 1671]MDF2180880.1 hydroxymethylglutaryl-CoA lyase [Neptuniibacter sp. CAU 1671]
MAHNALPKRVRLVEVGPRDGLQNEPALHLNTALKVKLIERLAACGLTHIECGSFVSASKVPQMADSAGVFQQIRRHNGVRYAALTPNLRAVQDAINTGVSEVAVFTAASDAFNQHNIHCTTDESLQRFAPAIELAQQHQLPVRAYISTVIECPYSGPTDPVTVANLAEQLTAMGCYEISLGDTIGTGTPLQTARLLETVTQQVPVERIAVHFHNTYGQALANILTALQFGVSVIDTSIAGLGGCPYAPGASGNIATEDVLYMLQGMGIETGVSLEKLVSTSHWICQQLAKENDSRVSQALKPLAGVKTFTQRQ